MIESYIKQRRILNPVKHVKWSFLRELLTRSWPRLLSYRNQSIDLQSKSMDRFLYDNGLRHEIINNIFDWVLSYTFNMNKPSMT